MNRLPNVSENLCVEFCIKPSGVCGIITPLPVYSVGNINTANNYNKVPWLASEYESDYPA